jgi:predicted ester cyclase
MCKRSYLHAAVDDLIAEGDKVVTYKTLTGTHSDEWFGIPAMGNHVEFKIISICRIKDNKISEFLGLQDEITLRQQLKGS